MQPLKTKKITQINDIERIHEIELVDRVYIECLIREYSLNSAKKNCRRRGNAAEEQLLQPAATGIEPTLEIASQQSTTASLLRRARVVESRP